MPHIHSDKTHILSHITLTSSHTNHIRTLFVGRFLDDEACNQLIASLIWLQGQNSKDPITLYFNVRTQLFFNFSHASLFESNVWYWVFSPFFDGILPPPPQFTLPPPYFYHTTATLAHFLRNIRPTFIGPWRHDEAGFGCV